MKVKIYLEEGAKMPTKSHSDDFAWDITATSRQDNAPINGCITYGTGIHIALPEKYGAYNLAALIYPRSSIANTGLVLSNGTGIIDAGYRGEIMAKFYKVADGNVYKVGERICQMVLSNGEDIEWVQVATLEELGTTDRGSGGYGSTGR